MIVKNIVTKSAQETREAAAEFVGREFPGKGKSALLVCLWGELGSGKTTFCQGAAAALGVKDIVNSPTFLIMRKYLLGGDHRGQNLYHFDLYRIADPGELLELGWEEILSSPDNLVLVEWPERLGSLLAQERIDIRFTTLAPEEREVEITDNRQQTTNNS